MGLFPPQIITRWSHHLLHRLPFSLAPVPAGELLLLGQSPGRILLGCGGSLLQREADGLRCLVAEGDGAAEALGLRTATAGGLKAAEIANRLQAEKPVAIFTPFMGSADAGERAMTGELAGALAAVPGWRGEVWMYETLTPLWPNRGIDISKQAGAKRDALDGHVSEGLLSASLGLNRYRGLRPVKTSVEAFLVLRESRFRAELARWKSAA